MRSIVAALIVSIGFSVSALAEPATRPSQSLFNPARHMRVSEVHPGMKGYGLSVFKGTTVEKFDVEVVSVLHNFNPKRDVILVRCGGQNLEHTGAIAGMSGSPIFLSDDHGRSRLIGAFAYGFPLAKDPVGGVQPIEYMLDLPADAHGEPITTVKRLNGSPRAGAEKRIRFSPLQCLAPRGLAKNSAPAAENSARLAPLVTPLMTSGFPSRLIDQFAPVFRAYGFELLQAG